MVGQPGSTPGDEMPVTVEQCLRHQEDLEKKVEGKESSKDPEDVFVTKVSSNDRAGQAADEAATGQEDSVDGLLAKSA